MHSAKSTFKALLGIAFLMFLVFSPVDQAHAQTPVSAQCIPSEIVGFVPYVYEGQLHSFDYFHSGLPGTILKTTVGNIELTPNYTSVWISGTSTQKVHVDVPGWYALSGSVPIHVQVLSRTGCLSSQTFLVTLPAASQGAVTPAIVPVEYTGPSTKPGAQVSPSTTGGNTSQPNAMMPSTTGSASIDLEVSCAPAEVELSWSAPTKVSSEFAIERAATGASFTRLGSVSGKVFTFVDTRVTAGTQYAYRVIGISDGRAVVTSPTKECGVPVDAAGALVPGKVVKCGWATSWWTVLLIAQIVASLLVINLLVALLQGNGWRFTLALFVPFALLLGLWFAFDSCRSNQWFPIMVTLITLATLFAPTFFKDTREEISR